MKTTIGFVLWALTLAVFFHFTITLKEISTQFHANMEQTKRDAPEIARKSSEKAGQGAIDGFIKATTGIDREDQRKHGIWGGRNSFFRKPFG